MTLHYNPNNPHNVNICRPQDLFQVIDYTLNAVGIEVKSPPIAHLYESFFKNSSITSPASYALKTENL